jgi:hypothetical protein
MAESQFVYITYIHTTPEKLLHFPGDREHQIRAIVNTESG